MDYGLLVDLEVIDFLDSFQKKARKRLPEHFIRLRSTLAQYSDSHENDQIGGRIEISVITGYAIHNWIDFPDRHVKIFAIKPAYR